MMNSSYDSDDDPFGQNPFRTNTSDLLDQPNIMVNQPLNQPDPNSGMTGSFDLSHDLYNQNRGPPMQQQQQQQQPRQPLQQPQTQYLSGSMDSNGNNNNVNRNRNNNNNNYGGTSEVPSTPPSRFAWCTSCLSLSAYKQYFDIDTADIAKRIKAALTQFHEPDQFRTAVLGDEPNNDAELKGPDLYGPLWISATLIFMLGVTANINAYFHHQAKHKKASSSDEQAATVIDEEFEADLHHLMKAATVVAIFAFGVPTGLWLTSMFMGMPVIKWAMWTCCYGYAQMPYLLASLIVWLPFELIDWIVLGCATGASVLLVVRNLSTPLLSQDTAGQVKSGPVLLAILGFHVIYCFTLKIGFYR